jgi:UDP:flavonoid glycosyltransferase YjiC (YdhE family)
MHVSHQTARPRFRYLFATVPAAGHVHPVVPVADALVARGHQVRWLTGSTFRDLVSSTGATFEPLVHAFDPAEGSTFSDRFPEREGLSGLAGIRFDLRHVFLDEIPGQVADLQRARDL